MHYNTYTDDSGLFRMRGYKVSHPTIDLSKSIWGLAQILFTVFILRWAWMTSYSDHAFAFLIGTLVVFYGIYRSNFK